MAQLHAWWRGVRRTCPSSPRIHMAPGVLPYKTLARHSGETKAPADTVRKPKNNNNKKNGKPGTILVPYQWTSSLSVLSAAQLIQQHTFPSLTQSQYEIYHSSSSSPPLRHMTMHMHLPRAFSIQYFNIYDLKLTSQNLNHFYQCIGTHQVHSTLITTIVTFLNFGFERYTNITYFKRGKNSLKLQFQRLRKKICLPKRPVTSLQRSMRTGRPVALKTTYLTGRDDTLPQNDISPATSSSSRWTPALIAKVNDHPENQRRQPSMNDLTLNERSTGLLILSSPLPRRMTMHMHPPRAFNIQYSNIYDLKLASQTLYHFNNAKPPTTFGYLTSQQHTC